MRGINLILRNSLRNTFRRPAKLIGLSALVALMALVLSLVVNINTRVVETNNHLQRNSNLHTIVMALDPFDRVPNGDVPGYEEAPKNSVAAQQYWLYRLQQEYNKNLDTAFYWSRTEAREFSQVNFGSTQLTIKVIAKTTPDNDLNRPTPGIGSQVVGVDELVIFEGRKPQMGLGHEVVVDNVFAQKHGLKLNDIIRIQSDNWGKQLLVDSPQNAGITPTFQADMETIKRQISAPGSLGLNDPNGLYAGKYEQANDWYQIVGFGASADFTMPVLNQASPIPNRDKEALFYVDPSVFGLREEGELGFASYNQRDGRLTVSSNNEWESFYSLANKNGQVPSPGVIQGMNQRFNVLIGKTVNPQNYFYGRDDVNYRYASRTKTLTQVMKYYSAGILVFLLLLIIVIVFSITLILDKQVDHSRGQVGILKSLGYKPWQIGLNYAMTPIFTSIIGGILGFAIAIPISSVLIKEFMNYFVLDYGTSKFNWVAFVLTILVFFVLLNLITFIVINLVVRKNTAELVSGQKHLKVSPWAQFWKAQVAGRPFNVKLQTALLLRASGKMTLVGAIVLIATILFTTFFAGPDILDRNQTASFYGLNYQQLVEYVDPVYNNPFTFYKTFDIEHNLSQRAQFRLASTLDGYTSLPVDEQAQNYDLNKIASDYFNASQSGEYYSLLIPRDGEQIELISPNYHFLAGYGVASSIEFYRFASQWGITNPLAVFMFNQWPDYVTLTENLKANTDLRQNLVDFQNFYRKVTSGIGMSVSQEFWLQTTHAIEIPDNQTKIARFNSNNVADSYANSKIAANKMSDSKMNANLIAIKQKTVSAGVTFQLTDDSWGVGSHRIQPPIDKVPGDKSSYVDDYYALMNVATLSDAEVELYLQRMLVWMGALIENRVDQALVQTAYSRSSYFVQQSMKNAFNNQNEYVPYYQAFGIVPYNAQQEQYGTFFRVNETKKGKQFKVYGIQNNNRYLDLRNKRDGNLITKLYASPDEEIAGEKIYPIVINQSVAKTLGLTSGGIVGLNVLQKQLTYEGTPAQLEQDWTIGNTPDSNNQFKQFNSLSYESWAFKGLNLYNILSGLAPIPNDYYQKFLDGKLLNREITHPVKFKIVGIHQGYGDSQAWIKNEDANEILNFSPLRDFFWKNFFTSQWNGVFANSNLNIGGYSLQFVANPAFDSSAPGMASYNSFKNLLLNSEDPQIRQGAMIINTIFENSFPIFNYKYSNKSDVGDLSNAISVAQNYGDYSPIAMNGATGSAKQIEGIAEGAMNNIVPVSIKKQILSQISGLVRLVLALLILAVILITFVIVFLTVTLIIDDNVRFIATMKVLGYSDKYIVKAVLSMYFVVIAFAFLVGFIAGWFIFAAIVHAFQPIVVLPLAFPAWLPFVVALAIGGVYLITLGIGYWTITKTNPITVLQSEVT